jgi:hypothetical protein
MSSVYHEQLAGYGRGWHRPWLVLLALLTVSALWCYWTHLASHFLPTGRKAFVREETTAEALDSLRRAPRAMVFLHSPRSEWSCVARERFLSAAAWLADDVSVPDIRFFVLDEESSTYRAWLESLPAGDWGLWARGWNGCVLWLERGRVVTRDRDFRALQFADRVVDRTREVWAHPLHRALQLPERLQRSLESR